MRLTIAGALLFANIPLTAATIVIDPNPIVTASSITSNVTGLTSLACWLQRRT
jgi:hypothetical protein